MPEKGVICRAKARRKTREAPSTEAGDFVREEMSGAWSAKQAFAIGMSRGHRCVSSILLAVALFSSVVLSGCAARGSYRVYDHGYSDYHAWDGNEVVYYQRWEVETHRDHREFKKRRGDEQKEYWTWRHNHHDDKH